MLDNRISLLEVQNIRLGSFNHERDPEDEAKWTHDSEFMYKMELKPMRPLTPEMVKQGYESLEKPIVGETKQFIFAIRDRKDDHLLGKAIVEWIDWSSGNGYLRLGIGSHQDRCRGYGTQALELLLHFAFSRLNLFRVTAVILENNTAALALISKFRFQEEVRRKKAIIHNGQEFDLIAFGLLCSEWAEQQSKISGISIES